jgi:fructokinase
VYAGIEAGGTKFVVAVGTGPDDLSEPVSFPTTTPAQTLDRTVATVRELVARDGRDLMAIGVACFGPVDLHPTSPTYGHITTTPKPGWQDADVVGPLVAALGVPVGFDTDVNGAALGESRWGATQGLDASVYVTVGTGIGGGAIVGGNRVHGLLHPEMGHLLVRRHPEDDFPGVCPFHGDCLEGLACGPALAARWGVPATDLGTDEPAAVRIEAHYLAQLCLAVSLVVSPRRIVLGGGVLHLPGLLDGVRTGTRRLLAGYLTALDRDLDDYVVAPGLAGRAGVLGAIALAEEAARD